MKRISVQEAAIRKFKDAYYAIEGIWHNMPTPTTDQITIEQIDATRFKCSAPGKNKPYEEIIKVSPALDCVLLDMKPIISVRPRKVY